MCGKSPIYLKYTDLFVAFCESKLILLWASEKKRKSISNLSKGVSERPLETEAWGPREPATCLGKQPRPKDRQPETKTRRRSSRAKSVEVSLLFPTGRHLAIPKSQQIMPPPWLSGTAYRIQIHFKKCP